MRQTIANDLRFFIILSWTIALFACGEDEPAPPVKQEKEPQFGAVSGTITDAKTGNPIPGADVRLLDQTVETGADGKYTFTQIAYSEALSLAVNAPDYAPQTLTFAFNVERLVQDIALIPLTNPEAEIRQFFDTLSALLESRDMKNLEAIQAHFAEDYWASDDPITRFGLATGVIPANFENVIPSIKALFEKYDVIQFKFHNIQVNVTHARKASTRLNLDIHSEKGPRPDKNDVGVECQIDFRKEGAEWKATFWQLFKVDIRL